MQWRINQYEARRAYLQAISDTFYFKMIICIPE